MVEREVITVKSQLIDTFAEIRWGVDESESLSWVAGGWWRER